MRNLIFAIESSSEAADVGKGRAHDGRCADRARVPRRRRSRRPRQWRLQLSGRARTRVLRRVVLREALVLEHVQERRLAGIVQAKEENLGVLVGQTWEAQAQQQREREQQQQHRSTAPCESVQCRSAPRALSMLQR